MKMGMYLKSRFIVLILFMCYQILKYAKKCVLLCLCLFSFAIFHHPPPPQRERVVPVAMFVYVGVQSNHYHALDVPLDG